MSEFARDYLILVFAFAVGVLQMAASFGRLNGLLLLRSAVPSRLAGFALIIAAAVWFFASGPRNINDIDGGIAGTEQAGLFAIASFIALVVTFVLSSIVNSRLSRGKTDSPSDPQGFDALSNSDYAKALLGSLRFWWGKWVR